MKLISWNVNGIRSCVSKGFMEFFTEIDAFLSWTRYNSLRALNPLIDTDWLTKLAPPILDG